MLNLQIGNVQCHYSPYPIISLHGQISRLEQQRTHLKVGDVKLVAGIYGDLFVLQLGHELIPLLQQFD